VPVDCEPEFAVGHTAQEMDCELEFPSSRETQAIDYELEFAVKDETMRGIANSPLQPIGCDTMISVVGVLALTSMCLSCEIELAQ